MINCVLFCEFNVKKGPALVYCVPTGYFTNEHFDTVSDLLIPCPELCGKVIST